MIRRDFLKTALACSAAFSPLPSFAGVEPATPDTISISPDLGPAPIIKSFTARDHRRRLSNIAACERSIHSCLKKHLVTGYIPGQASYNLGEYPSRKPYDPDEYDEQ